MAVLLLDVVFVFAGEVLVALKSVVEVELVPEVFLFPVEGFLFPIFFEFAT